MPGSSAGLLSKAFCNLRLGASYGMFAAAVLFCISAVALAQVAPVEPGESRRSIESQFLVPYDKSVARFDHAVFCIEEIRRAVSSGRLSDSEHLQFPDLPDGSAHYVTWYMRDADRLDMLLLSRPVAFNLNADSIANHCALRDIINRSNRRVTLYKDDTIKAPPRITFYAFTKSASEAVSTLLNRQGDGSDYLVGHALYDSADSIPSFLHRSALSIRSDTTDAHPCSVLTGEADGYSLSLWLDPTVGYQPRRIEQRRTQSNSNGIDVTISAMHYSGLDESAYCDAANADIAVTRDARMTANIHTVARVTRVDFHPDFEKLSAFRFTAPPKLPVYNADDLSTHYRYRNGEFVVYTGEEFDADVAKVMEDSKRFAKSNSQSAQKAELRRYLVWSVAGIAIALLILAWYRIKHRSLQ